MNVDQATLPGLMVLEMRVWRDARGTFRETWQEERYAEAGLPTTWVQDNVSVSARHVLRGLHYQTVRPQGKLVTVLAGAVVDVAVDVRPASPTFGHPFSVVLSRENGRQIYVPPGFAHGFLVTTDEAVVHYKCTELYHPASERTLLWNDPVLGIEWPAVAPVLSEKDAAGQLLAQLRPDALPSIAYES